MNRFSTERLSGYITGLAHIGYVVDELASAIAQLQRVYGVPDSAVRIVPPFDTEAPTRFAFVDVAPGVQFELIQPIAEAFKSQLFAHPSGPGGINHLAYWVRDLDQLLEQLAVDAVLPGYVTPDGPVTTSAYRMVYLDPSQTGGHLIELLEPLAE